jgi:hypothetical protein
MQLVANNKVAPDGTLTAETFSGLSGESAVLQQTVTVSSSSQATFSLFLRSDTPQNVRLKLGVPGVTERYVDVTTTATWTRYSLTTSDTATQRVAGITGTADTNTFSVDIWGAQLESGNSMTSFIPTQASIGNRAADIVTMLTTDSPKGSATINVSTVSGQTVKAGDMFVISGLLLQVAESVTATGTSTTVKLVNRLRKALTAGLPIDSHRAKIKWRLESSSAVSNLVGYTGPVSLSFTEDV